MLHAFENVTLWNHREWSQTTAHHLNWSVKVTENCTVLKWKRVGMGEREHERERNNQVMQI